MSDSRKLCSIQTNLFPLQMAAPPPPPPPGAWGGGGGSAWGGAGGGPAAPPAWTQPRQPREGSAEGGADSDSDDGSTGPMGGPDGDGPAAGGPLGYNTNVMDKKKLYGLWFMTADADRDGRVTGKDAVNFFAYSGLTREVLARVWALADHQRAGYLDVERFATAMDLVSLAQSGETLSMAVRWWMEDGWMDAERGWMYSSLDVWMYSCIHTTMDSQYLY